MLNFNHHTMKKDEVKAKAQDEKPKENEVSTEQTSHGGGSSRPGIS